MKTILVVESGIDCWESIVNADLGDNIIKVVLRPQDTLDSNTLQKRVQSITSTRTWSHEARIFASFQVRKLLGIEDETKYDCSRYYHFFAEQLVNFEHSLVPIKMLKPLKWHLFHTYAYDTKVFIRPDSGIKTFTGGLFDLQDFDKQVDSLLEIQPNGLVLVSNPKKINAEFRFFIHENQIVDYSLYKFQDNLTIVHSAPESIKKYVESVIINVDKKEYPMYVVDVAFMQDQSYKVIEMNGYFTSDLYACDGKKIVESIM